jgi:hypothetical protein
MDSRIAHRRRLIALVLAIAFAAETVGVVAASMPTGPVGGAPAAQAPVTIQAAVEPGPAQALAPRPPASPVAPGERRPIAWATPAVPEAAPEATAKPRKAPKAEAKAAPKPKKAPKATPKATSKPKSSGTRKVTAADFRGTNHVWIPALGISKSVQAFPCDRNRPPDNYMYRWGCAGDNNVYLMGHSYSVMKPLYNAYYSGRLKTGMKAYYAGSNGKVHTYTVRWWKKTLPTPDASWAWAAQSVPSMTLQTCVGQDSRYRLMVRLVEVGG